MTISRQFLNQVRDIINLVFRTTIFFEKILKIKLKYLNLKIIFNPKIYENLYTKNLNLRLLLLLIKYRVKFLLIYLILSLKVVLIKRVFFYQKNIIINHKIDIEYIYFKYAYL